MRFRTGWRLFVATALVAGACENGDTAETVLTPTTNASTTTQAVALTPTTTTSTTTTAAVSSSTRSRVPHDAVVGGTGFQAMLDVTMGGPGLVAVGSTLSGDSDAAAVWTSSDGVTWSRVPHDEAVLGGPDVQAMWSVTVGGPGLVAVGWDGLGVDYDAAVWTSPDGVTWSRVPHNEAVFGGPDVQAMWSVTVGGPGLVAVGWDGLGADYDAAVWTSPDGIIWSRVSDDEAGFDGPGLQALFGVTAGGPGVVAVGSAESGDDDDDAAVWTSPDGITWSRVADDKAVFGGTGAQQMVRVTVGGPGLVAVGSAESGDDDNAAVWTSPDGVTWSRVADDKAVFGGTGAQKILDVTAGRPGLVAVGRDRLGDDDNAAVWTSPDGVTWSRVPHNEAVLGGAGRQTMAAVTVGGPGFVAVGFDQSGDDRDPAVWVETTQD